MELRIYLSDMSFQGIIDNFTSLIWTRKYQEVGTFEMHAPLVNENVELLKPNNLIKKSDETVVIEDVTISNEITVKGRFLSSYLDRRLIRSTYSFSGLVEQAMYNLIGYCTPIPNLSTSTLKGLTETCTFQATMKNLLSIEQKLALTSGYGFKVNTDFINKTLTFEVYKGVDRSTSQNINPRVIFSDKYTNINQASYTYNSQLHKTLCVVGGKGEGSERVYVEVGGGQGLELREVFFDGRSINDTDITENEYLDALRQKGYETLESDCISESMDFSVVANSTFVYKKDYDLGDIVSIQKDDWGLMLDVCISEIEEVYENGGLTVNLTLGSPLKSTVEWSE